MNRSAFVKLRALIAVLFVSAFFVAFMPVNVSADASVSTSNVQTWGSGGLISFNISGVSTGEIINVTISTTGTILSAYDNMGSTVLVYGETATCAFTVNDPSISYYQIAVEGVNISGLSASVWVSAPEAPEEPEQPAEAEQPAEPAEPEQPAAEAPADPQPAADAVQVAVITEASEEEVPEAEEGEESAAPSETTVPRVIMDAAGNLIVVTPTPTSFPYMESTNVELKTHAPFPVKPVIGSLVIIAILGARFAILKSRGLKGKQLAIEFIPTVGEIYDRAQFKKSQKRRKQLELAKQKEQTDTSNSASARAAEAAREAQKAREELKKAAEERNALMQKTSAATNRSGRPSQPKGIKTDPGFKFTAPLAKPSIDNSELNTASPFKQVTEVKKEHEPSSEIRKLKQDLEELKNPTATGDEAPARRKVKWATKTSESDSKDNGDS